MNDYLKLSIINDEISTDILKTTTFLKENAISYVEIRTIDGVNILNSTDTQLKHVKTVLDKNNIKVSCISSPLFKWYPTTTTRKSMTNSKDLYGFPDVLSYKEKEKYIKQAFKIAKFFDCNYIRAFSILYENSRAKSTDFISIEQDLYNLAAQLSKETKIKILIENGYYTNFNSPKQLFKLRKLLSENFGFLLDLGSFFFINKDLVMQDILENLDMFDYLHIKDFDLDSKSYVFLGKGSIDYHEFFKKLFEENLSIDFIALEPHLKNANKQKLTAYLESFKNILEKEKKQ